MKAGYSGYEDAVSEKRTFPASTSFRSSLATFSSNWCSSAHLQGKPKAADAMSKIRPPTSGLCNSEPMFSILHHTLLECNRLQLTTSLLGLVKERGLTATLAPS